MTEITSFNHLFTEAARRGLRLNSFHQMPDGIFHANWRLDGAGKSGEPWFGPVATNAQPFLAAHHSYVMADLQAPHVKTDADLFG